MIFERSRLAKEGFVWSWDESCVDFEVDTPEMLAATVWLTPFEIRAAWTALAVRRAVPANRAPDDRFHR